MLTVQFSKIPHCAKRGNDDGNVALLVGTAGTIGIVSLAMLLHNAIHGPELTIKAHKEQMDYQNLSQKLAPYVVKEVSLTP